MKNFILGSWFLVLGSFVFGQTDYTRYVDPFIGTGGHGHTYPGATLPFGMVQLSPDTRIDGSWDGCSGYHYSDSLIYGFSHTHLSGTGVSDYGDIMIMPAIGEVDQEKKYSSSFKHSNETANAGYYSVVLDKGIIKAELTATTRVGFHKYTFPKTKEAQLILDLEHRDEVINSQLKIIDKTHLSGYRRSKGWAKDQTVYFYIVLSKPFVDFKMRCDSISMDEKENYPVTNRGKRNRSVFHFDESDGLPLLLKVAISGVSEEGAKKNMEAELSHWDFERVKREAHDAWQKELGKIQVTEGTDEQMKIFYTALYHCFIQPNIYNDVDGQYRGRDLKVHKAEGFNYYTVFSLWDTFRAWHPLMTIIDRKRVLDYIKTFLAQYEQGGLLPVWELSSNETECMIGYHSVSVIADAAVKGITGFDMEKAFEAMKKSAESRDRYGLGAYMDKGCLSVEDENESVSKTLEYAYDDWCIAQMASLLKKEKDYQHYMERSQYWKNLFDPETGFIRPRKNGGWYEPFDPREVNNNYTEANAWQYTFFVPHEISSLIGISGGLEKFEKKLDELFTTESKTTGREQSDITGLIGQYAHGNEPSHHMGYLYNHTWNIWKTQEKTSRILNDFYHATPDGLIGNEDCGQMSAWYVMGAMGIYEICPGEAEYALSCPIFPVIQINLENGKTFSIRIRNRDPFTNPSYAKTFHINGNSSGLPFMKYSELSSGGVLVFDMQEKSRGDVVKAGDFNNQTLDDNIIKIPVIHAASTAFKNQQNVLITSSDPNHKIYYTLDGSTPTLQSRVASRKSQIRIESSCTIKATAVNEKGKMSKISTAHFFKHPHPDWKINLLLKYSSQYTAGGNEGLIDGIRGDANWRKGNWQGYQTNFECVIDLGKEQEVKKVSAGFLQDVGAWILMPKQVEFSFSTDGRTFSEPFIIKNPLDDHDTQSQTKDFSANITSQIARYVKVKAVNYGKLPEWHAGAGGDAWIFADEIVVE